MAGAAPKWQARDDVYQVGQLLAMLVKGDARARVRTGEIRGLPCSDHLKEIVHRCIGERRKRYESADELIEALRKRPATLRTGALRSLKGVHLAFTGILVMPRQAAARAARKAGAKVHRGPSVRTTVVVRGRPNPRQAAGRDGGLKLMEIKRLREKGSPHHPPERGPLLASGGPALTRPPRPSLRGRWNQGTRRYARAHSCREATEVVPSTLKARSRRSRGVPQRVLESA